MTAAQTEYLEMHRTQVFDFLPSSYLPSLHSLS